MIGKSGANVKELRRIAAVLAFRVSRGYAGRSRNVRTMFQCSSKEGHHDKDSKEMTMIGEGPGQDGKMTKYKMVTEYKDDDTIIFTMSGGPKEGDQQEVMVITYKRKK